MKMRKYIFLLLAALFTSSLTGVLSCSSDPCSQAGGGCGMGGGGQQQPPSGSGSSQCGGLNCNKGYHQVGKKCVKNAKKK